MQQTTRPLKTYRPDIDGLRAIAVLAVIAFHLDLSLFAGRHIGVDVFFVLSGFLITFTITKKTLNKKFSIKTFYLQRINRLFPALLATVGATFITSLFVLLPNDFHFLPLLPYSQHPIFYFGVKPVTGMFHPILSPYYILGLSVSKSNFI